jgi:ABC-2 type transport system permease protein
MRDRPWRAIRTIVWKDLTVVRRSPLVLLPMVVVPLIMQVLLPVGVGLAALYAPGQFTADPDLQRLLASVPPQVTAGFGDLGTSGRLMILTLVYLFAPLYLIVPMMVSSVIAADSFVGERERKTLEALLYTPLSDQDLLLAKMLTGWLAALVVSTACFVLYSIVVNAVGFQLVGRLFFPNGLWLLLVFWVVPAVAGLGLATTVLISSRVNTFQEAYQAGGIIVVPIIGLVLAQLAGVVFLSLGFVFGLGLIVWLVDALLLWYGRRSFRREELLARL